jgi:hypothetical protein
MHKSLPLAQHHAWDCGKTEKIGGQQKLKKVGEAKKATLDEISGALKLAA